MSDWTYQKKILAEFYRRGIPLGSGDVYHIQTLHDDWCDRLHGRGPCNCDPEIGKIGPEPPSRSR